MRTPADELSRLEERSLLRTLRPLDSPQGPSVRRDGRTLINFSSNDYLGLATHPALREAARKAIDTFGVGSGASRLVCGSLPPHGELEARIAALKGTQAALTFSSGYATAIGTLAALAGRDDIVILDKLCHASLVDGARLSGATIRVFPHNHLDRLQHLLRWAGRTRKPDSRVLVATEAVFSMDGDRAPLRAIADLAHAHDALLLVDEAHAFGILGPHGAGLASELGLGGDIDLHMGTLSKAAGASGGYIAASSEMIALLVNRARSLVYSTAPAPAIAAAAAAAVDLIASQEGDALRERLWRNVRQWADARPRTTPADEDHAAAPSSAIVPLVLGYETAALAAAADLERQGILAPAIRFPTVPRGTARLRLTFSAAHTSEDIDRLTAAVATLTLPPP